MAYQPTSSGVGSLFGSRNNGRLLNGKHREMHTPNRCRAARKPGRKDQVARLLADGARSSEIARALGITEANVATYVQRIRKDLGWQAV